MEGKNLQKRQQSQGELNAGKLLFRTSTHLNSRGLAWQKLFNPETISGPSALSDAIYSTLNYKIGSLELCRFNDQNSLLMAGESAFGVN